MSTLGCASLAAQNFTSYDLIVPKSTAPSDVTVVDGRNVKLPPDRSFVIGIEGGTRNPIQFTNWTGTSQHPVILTNKHGTGRVRISDEVPGDPASPERNGLTLLHCQYIQVRGDNDPDLRCGIEIARAGRPQGGSGKRGLEVTGRSTDVEISFLEIHHAAFAGIMIKQDPTCDPTLCHPTLVYRNIRVHDNYIHDVGGEGMYIGYSFWPDDKCPANPDAGYAHNIEGLHVHHNLIERAAWDGIQVGAATADVDIHHNVIVNAGLGGDGKKSGDTGVGVQIGAGTTGWLRDNVIINSRNTGVALFGLGNNSLCNNLIVGGKVGVFSDNRPASPAGFPPERQTQRGSVYALFNNTFVGQTSHVMWTMSEITDNQFKNNLAIAPNESADFIRYEHGATGVSAGNRFQRDPAGIGFADVSAHDYRLLNSSTAVDRGTGPLPPEALDAFGVARPQGQAPDPGYAEAGTLSVALIAKPPQDGQPNGRLTAAAINGAPPYAYAWSTGARTATISQLPAGYYSVTVTDATRRTVRQATYLFNGAQFGAPVAAEPGR